MGTNYYYEPKQPCECCKRPYAGVHIGKSSYGWVFSLHVFKSIELLDGYKKYFAHDIDDFEDWKEVFNPLNGGRIVDEYDREISVHDFMKVVMERDGYRGGVNRDNELSRHDVDGVHCIKNAEFCDHITGEFS